MRWGFGAEAAPAAQKYCQHATCREQTERELAFMGATLSRGDLLEFAKTTHAATVVCKHLPRKGPIRAPFPPTQIHPQEKP